MTLEQTLTADIQAAVKALYGQDVTPQQIQLQKTKR